MKPMTSTTITTTATTKKPTTVAMRQGLGKLHSPHSDYGHAALPSWNQPGRLPAQFTHTTLRKALLRTARFADVTFTSVSRQAP